MLEALPVGEMHHHLGDLQYWMEQVGIKPWVLWGLDATVQQYCDPRPH